MNDIDAKMSSYSANSVSSSACNDSIVPMGGPSSFSVENKEVKE